MGFSHEGRGARFFIGPPGVEKDSGVKFLGPVKFFLGGEELSGCLEKRVA